MNVLHNLKSGILALLQKKRVEAELDEELNNYLEASAADKQRRGMTERQAHQAARIEMGSRNSVKQQVWSSRWESGVDSLWQDTRVSLRMLAKSPGFTLVALLSLALGIGANTAIFTLIHQVLLRNLPVDRPEQLVTFGKSQGAGVVGGVDLGFNDLFPWDFTRALEANPGPFAGIAAYGSFSPDVSVRTPTSGVSGQALQMPATVVSGNYFSLLGAKPLLGRAITPSDDAAPGAGAVVVVSEHFWMQTLSGDQAVLGKTLTINSTPFLIIGVMPGAFHGVKQDLTPAELWMPISMQAQVLQQPSFLIPNGPYFLQMFGRMAGGTAENASLLAQDQAWLDQQVRTAVQAKEGTPISADRQQEIGRIRIALTPAEHGVSSMRSRYSDSLTILMGATVLVLLIACANLANFLLARAATRQREIATRLALGSSRLRILRQSLIETTIISLLGGAFGLMLAFSATRTLISMVAADATYTALSATPDVPVLLFALGASLLTGLLFGLAPALTAARTGAAQNLSSSTRTTSSSRTSRFWPKTLVTAQVMLSLLLLVGAGLFLRTLRNLENQDYGFERSHLVIAGFGSRTAGYKPGQLPALHHEVIERLEGLPGVASAALCETAPMSYGSWNSSFHIAGYVPGPKESMNSILNKVSGDYFKTTSIPIVAGRAISKLDSVTSLKVVVINEALAHRFFPKGDAIGHSITIDQDEVAGPWQIVGVAGDTKVSGPRSAEVSALIYIPLEQISATVKHQNGEEDNNARYASMLLLRTSGDPAQSIANLRATVAQIDPNLPLTHVMTMPAYLGNFITKETLISKLTILFALLALLLACIGLYGVMSYNVVRRTNEIGIRLALGAQTQTVLWMVLQESLLLLCVGLALGLPLTFAGTRLIRQQLFGITAVDPSTFAAAIAIVSAMTVIAAWLPARRATRVDPMVALRCD
jgi:predicted permease